MKTRILLSLMLALAFTLGSLHQAQATKHVITQVGLSFNPATLSNVNIGDTIRWVWTSGFHTTTSSMIPVQANPWDAILSGSSPFYEYRVQVSGVYHYVCTPHASMGMVGTFTVNNAAPLTISGKVYDDANGLLGLPLNTVDGALTNAGGTIHANLVNAANVVMASLPVTAGGTFTFSSANGVQANTTFKIILTQGAMGAGAFLSAATLPANWVSTGEYLGTGAGNDGTVNSILTVALATQSLSNANFGIEQLPTPLATDPEPQANPGSNNFVTLASTAFSGTDPESPSGYITQVHIMEFPADVTSLSINGTQYNVASWPGTGVFIPASAAGNPLQTISVDPVDGSVTTNIMFSVVDNAGKESSASVGLTLVFNDPFNTITGTLSYNNDASGGLPNTTVTLRNLADNVLYQSAVTNTSGQFTFTGVPDGNYSLQAVTMVPWGGVNATDALAIMRHFVGITHLSGLQLTAANVDNNTFVNSLDALITARRFVGLISSFPVGDWYFQSPSITVSGSNTFTLNFQGICYGDADGSYSSFISKKASAVTVEHSGTWFIRPGQEVTVPVTLSQPARVGAVSLVLSLPEEVASLENVIIPGNQGNLAFQQQDGSLKISWFSLEPLTPGAHEPLLFITFKASDHLSKGESLEWSLAGYSELAGGEAKPIQNITVEIPRLVSSPQTAIKHIITQSGMTFVPANLAGVLPGDTVQWVWTSGFHTTTSAVIPTAAVSWDQVLSSSSPGFNYIPEVSGEYNYVCTPHASLGMVGKFIVSNPATGIDRPLTTANTFTLSPNPVCDDHCLLSVSSKKGQKVIVKIFDMLGAEVRATESALAQGSNTLTLDLAGLKDGVYFVQVWNDNNKLDTRRLIKR
jgi:plastocyanin